MDSRIEKAKRDLPKLRRFADDLITIVDELLSQPIRYKQNDHLAFMALGFTCAQAEHLKAICTLVDAGFHKDAALIARTVIEGLCRLLWAAQKPEERPRLWRMFSIIDDFRIVDPEVWKTNHQLAKELKEKLKKYGPLFYTQKAKQAAKEGKPLPKDPYWPDWTGHNIRKICSDAGGQELYIRIYRDVSCWVHWSPRGIGSSLDIEENRVRYTTQAPENAATALATGFQALLETALLLDSKLELGFSEPLQQLRAEYIRELNN